MNSSKKPSVTGEYLFENVVAINESVNKLSVSHPLVSNLYKEVGNLFVKAKTVRLDGKKIFSEEETPSYSKDDLSDFKRSGVFAIEYDHPFFYPGMESVRLGLGYEVQGKEGIAIPVEKRLLVLVRFSREEIFLWMEKVIGKPNISFPGWMENGALLLFQSNFLETEKGEKWILHPFFAVIPFDQDGAVAFFSKGSNFNRIIDRFLERCSGDGKMMRNLFFYCFPIFLESCLNISRQAGGPDRMNELVMADFVTEVFVLCYFLRNHRDLLGEYPV